MSLNITISASLLLLLMNVRCTRNPMSFRLQLGLLVNHFVELSMSLDACRYTSSSVGREVGDEMLKRVRKL